MRHFNLAMVTGLGKGKLTIQPVKLQLKTESILYPVLCRAIHIYACI